MINTAFLTDSIDILQETKVKSPTGWIEDCIEIHSWVPASLGCWQGEIEIFSCLPKKRQGRDLCVEIGTEIELACFNKDIIIRVYRNGCDIWLYRVHDIIPVRFISQDSLYSYHMVATQISDNINE